MLAFLIESFVSVISAGGYLGLAFLMSLESMIAPVPSEAVMPFAGFLIWKNEMAWGPVIFFSTLGSVVGSLISYYIGARFGRPIILKYGKYLLLNEHHLEMTEKFFQKFGQNTIFISRFIPIVRHFISLPAGTSKMNLAVFAFYTVLGASLWNTLLAYLGFHLGNNWSEIRKYGETMDTVMIALIVFGVSYFLYRNRKKKIA